ncbi:MAG: hypothetical protein JWO43_116 [Candidatus Adlerbacteria bacterium]|nr:hypothetical protein [Candidatus Adlerbacteria bacterium]
MPTEMKEYTEHNTSTLESLFTARLRAMPPHELESLIAAHLLAHPDRRYKVGEEHLTARHLVQELHDTPTKVSIIFHDHRNLPGTCPECEVSLHNSIRVELVCCIDPQGKVYFKSRYEGERFDKAQADLAQFRADSLVPAQ